MTLFNRLAPKPLQRDKITIAYVTNYYDGMISGHAWYEGRYCIFNLTDESQEIEDSDDPDSMFTKRTFSLSEITGESLKNALISRQLFQDMVGYHNTYILGGKHAIPYDAKKAQDFDGFFGRNGKTSKYKALADAAKHDPKDLIYIGDFE